MTNFSTISCAPAPINAPTEPFRKDMTVSTCAINQLSNPSAISGRYQSGFSTIGDKQLPNLSTISDRDLLELCQEYGGNCRMWKRKFEELLPEVLKRHLYKKHRFVSIYEFAAKLCGLSHESVDNVIRVYEQLEDKPILRSLVVEFGWGKLRIVSGIATPETDASWAEKVRVLPKSSLEVFVRDLKRQEEKEKIEKLMNGIARVSQKDLPCNNFIVTGQLQLTDQKEELNNRGATCQNFPGENLTEIPSVACFGQPNLITMPGEYCENSWPTMSLKIDPEVEFRLRKLKARIEKGKKEKISFNQLFEIMLDLVENKERVVKKSRSAYGLAPLKLCEA